MEYKIFQKIQKIPYVFRIILGIFFILLGILAFILPGFPGAIPGVIIGLIFFSNAKKIKNIIKIRKGLLHLFKNFSFTKFKHKWQDIKSHLKSLFYK